MIYTERYGGRKFTNVFRTSLRTKHLHRQLVFASRLCGLWASYKPNPIPMELTWKYNSMLTYIPVSFLFSFKNCSG